MKRSSRGGFPRISLALLLLGLGCSRPGFAAVSNSVVIDLSNVVLANGLAQAADSGSATLPAAPKYNYVLAATVHGTGALAFVVPTSKKLEDVLNTVSAGSGDFVTGSADDPGSVLPFGVFNKDFDAHNSSSAFKGTITADVDASGKVGFNLKNTVLTLLGSSSPANTLVFEPGSKLTVSVPAVASGLTFVADSVSVDENAGTLTLTINRVGGAQGAVSVHCSTVDGTGVHAKDFDAVDQTINFADGVTSQPVVITIRDNQVSSPARSFKVKLDTPTGGAILGDIASVTVSIVDNEISSFAPLAGSYDGLFQTNAPGVDVTGFMRTTVTKTGGYSVSVRIGGKSYSASGKLSGNGTVGPLPLPKSPSYQYALAVDRANGLTVTGQLAGGTLGAANLVLRRAPFSNTTPFARPGVYSVVFDPATPSVANPASSFPQGSGYATVTVKASGDVTSVGKFADGTSASGGGKLVGAGDWPLLISDKTRGVVAGTLTFQVPAMADDVAGDLAWIHVPQTSGRYQAGFVTTLHSFGSTFTKAASGALVLNLPSVTVTVGGGNLLQPFALAASIGAGSKLVVTAPGPTKLKVALKPSSNLFSGSFEEAAGGTRTKKFDASFHGAILQKQKRAAGYFLGVDPAGGASQSGSVTIK